MYNLFLGVHILIVGISIVCVMKLAFERNQIQQKLLMLTIICAFNYCLGYCEELMSKSLNQAISGIKIEYIGASFILTSFAAFLVKYLKKEFNRIIFSYFLIVDVLTLISVLRLENLDWYYKSIGFIEDGLYPHVVIERGPLYYIFFSNCIVLIIYSFALVIEAYIKQKNDDVFSSSHVKKRTLRLLFITTCLPVIPYILGAFGVFRYFDIVPLGFLGAAILLLIIVTKDNIFDVVTGAHVQMFSSIDDAVIIVNRQMEFLEANKAAIRIFPVLFNFQIEKKCTKEVLAVFEDIENNDFSIEINGRYYERHSSKIYKDNVLIGYSVLLIDLTETKELMNQLQYMKNEAEKANKAKSTFLANVSHELRTPLNAVIGYSDLIIQETESQTEENHAYVIRKAADNLLSIINMILDISKIEAGKIDIIKSEYDTMELFTEVINIVSIPAKAKELELLFDIDPMIPTHLYGDKEHIRQVLINLLNNAVKFTDEGSVKLTVKGKKGGNGFIEVVYTITDTGRGIRPEDMKKIFERFEKADAGDGKVEGTGLGLFITKSLVGLMGGSLDAKSEYGVGSEFTMKLTQRVCSEDTISGAPLLFKTNEKVKSIIKLYAPKARVLSIDDNQINNGVFFEFCKKFGFEPKLVDSGFRAIELLKTNEYDLIFLDQMMPEMDGVETLKRIRALPNINPELCILAFTANAIRGNSDYLLSVGFDDVVLKPVGIKQLEEILEYYLPEEVKEIRRLEFDENYSELQGELESSATTEKIAYGFDISLGLEHCNGDEDLYRMTLEMLLDHVPGKLEIIKEYLKEKEYENYVIEVHALKNNAALIGATEISEHAKELEYAGKEGQYQVIEERTDLLIYEFQQLLSEVKTYLS